MYELGPLMLFLHPEPLGPPSVPCGLPDRQIPSMVIGFTILILGSVNGDIIVHKCFTLLA